MKLNKSLLLAVASLTAITAGCASQNEASEEPSTSAESSQSLSSESLSSESAEIYNIKFVNYDSTILQEMQIEEGVLPVYTGETPVKPATEQYHYVYQGWDKEVVPAVADATYTAVYEEVINSYTVNFLVDDAVYHTETVDYGGKVTKPADPVKEQTSEEIFFFVEWQVDDVAFDFESEITGDLNLVAKWDSVSATEHGDKCTFVHYPALAPTYAAPGHTEFWDCELHNNYTLEAPTVGTIVEAEGTYPGNIAVDDARYIAPLEGGNLYMSLALGKAVSGDAIVRSVETIDTILSVSFRYRMKNATEAKWIGVAISTSETPSCYGTYWEGGEEKPLPDVSYWHPITPSIDGAWHEVTLEIPEASGYLVFVHAAGEFAENTIVDIDNVYVEAGAGDYNEDFTNPTMFQYLDESAYLDGELKGNDFIRLSMYQSPELALAISKKEYQNITSISFKYRLSKNASSASPWARIIITQNGSTPGVYGLDADDVAYSHQDLSADGSWHQVNISISGSGYVAFGHESGHFNEGSTLDYDDIIINYGEGQSVVDHCDGILLFKPTANATHAEKFGIGSEEIKDVDRYLQVGVGSYGDTNALVYSEQQLTNVTTVTFKARFTGALKEGKESSWFGVYVSTDHSVYGGNTAQVTPSMFDGEWANYSFDVSGSGYVNIVHASGEFASGSTIDIDDIVVTYNEGAELNETFNEDAIQFMFNSNYCELIEK